MPRTVYCSDDLQYGVRIRSKNTALNKRFISFNGPALLQGFALDIDAPCGAFAAEDANVALPSITVINNENGHAHALYLLKNQVCITEAANSAPIRYLSAIERGYRRRIAADAGYAGTIIRNPLKHSFIDTGRLYDLSELDSWLDYEDKEPCKRTSDEGGIGRNVSLFNTVRRWAYKNVKEYPSQLTWQNAVLNQCNASNVFVVPLMQSEIRATAKSIAKWCWKHRHELNGKYRGKYGCSREEAGRVTASVVASKKQTAVILAIKSLQAANKKVTPTAVAHIANVSRPTAIKYLAHNA